MTQAKSPDGELIALLVDRYYNQARVSDGFFLIVVSENQDIEEAIRARNIEDSSALIATWASKVQLRWRSNRLLMVVCDACGIKAVDVTKKVDHVGPVNIVYEGFPERTAYD